MSLAYLLASNIVKLIGVKKIFAKDKDTILKYAKKQNQKNTCNLEKIKKKAKNSYCELIEVSGYPCIIFKKNHSFSDVAILQFYGSGMISAPDSMDFHLADRLVKVTGRDVYFPLYPLCIDQSIIKTYQTCFEIYKKMLQNYSAERINVLGFSSGAALALGIFLCNNELPSPLPVAKKIVAISPGGLPNLQDKKDQKLMAQLKELSKKDILIDAKYFKTAREILKHNENVPEYMLNGIKGNFQNFPKTHLYYGSDECLYAFAPYFKKAFQKYHIPYTLTVGKGMCHCYPLLRFFKEGKNAQDEIIELLK